jgi:hypothetical protein
MNANPLNETELAEILQMTQEGEAKLKEMSDLATLMAEKWRVKGHSVEKNNPSNKTKVS